MVPRVKQCLVLMLTVKIYDLAVKMIKLSGMTLRDDQHPEGDIEIEFSGLRKGEKLHEELCSPEEEEDLI